MVCGILIGTAIALGVGRLLMHRRGCHGGHWGGGGHWRRRGPWGVFHELGLDDKQREEVMELLRRAREAFEPVRAERSRWKSVAEAIVGDEFDRAKVEDAAARVQVGIDHAKEELVDILEQLHRLLSPEQRARLANRFSVTFAPAGGPYRS